MRAYKIRLYNSSHNNRIDKSIDVAREIYNHCIALHRKYYRMFGKYIGKYDMMKHIAKLKKTKKYAHWNTLNSQAVQNVAERIDNSYKAFFDHIKKKRSGKKRPPHFRKQKDYCSYTLKQCGYKFLDGNEVIIMKHKYKYFKSQDIEGNVKTVTVKKMPSGKYFLFVVTDAEFPIVDTRTGKSVGMDFGLKNFLILNSGEKIDSPQYFKQSLSKLKRLSRNYSLKQDGSRNQQKAYHELVLLYEKTTNQRRDWFFKLATELCREYDIIGIEDLNLNGMKALWGRKVSDLAYGEFVQILEHIARKYNTRVIKIDRYVPSTKVCSECGGYVNLSLKDREWTCPHCGAHHDRDINASINIRNLALRKA